MKVFASRFLEPLEASQFVGDGEWTWIPDGDNCMETYSSGNLTNTRESTYASEKDDRSDHDRPNEGMQVA